MRQLCVSAPARSNSVTRKGLPLDPGGERGFAYPVSNPAKLRMCRGWLRMFSARLDKPDASAALST